MGARLVSFAERNREPHADVPDDPAIAPDVAETQKTIATILKDQVGHDFSGYKRKTFMRRVHRRMDILLMTDLAGYVERLRKEPDEVTLLFRDLLIGVTNFFRDPEVFNHPVSSKKASDSSRALNTVPKPPEPMISRIS